MSLRLYRLYLFLTKIKKRLHSKVSPSGRIFLAFAALSFLFGFNTKQTMIYQLAALFVVLLFFSFSLSFFFLPTIRVRRVLPKTCTAGQKLTYLLRLDNKGENSVSGMIFTEQTGAAYPTIEEFEANYEFGEEERNYFDRKFGYYRWLWLLDRKAGAHFESFSLPQLMSSEHLQVQVSLLPLRRGYIQLAGYTIHRLDPLGLFKKEKLFGDVEKLLVLPKIYPVVQSDLSGARKYHQGGLTTSAGCGESGEFVSLREYRFGDPVKHIDWKVTARIGNTIVRQYQDEYFSRYGILLDTFTKQDNLLLEDAISVAASIIVQQDTTRNLIDLLFACDNFVTSVPMGRGQSDQHHMLEVLACISHCHDKDFSDLVDLVIAHINVVSGLILVLVDMDSKRKKLLEYLEEMRIPHKVILISNNRSRSENLLRSKSLLDVIVFDIMSDKKLVRMK